MLLFALPTYTTMAEETTTVDAFGDGFVETVIAHASDDLDEPTNHLDMESKATLEEALMNYEGSLITVSHDRWFLDQVVNRIWELQDGVVTVYYGNYTDYVRAKKGLPPLAEGEVSEV